MTSSTPKEGYFVCPFCRAASMLMFICGGSFTDRDHPSEVPAVFVAADANEIKVLAEARETYR